MNRPLMKHIGILLIVFIPAGLDGCGGGDSGGVSPASFTVSQVAVTPSLLALPKGSVQQFLAKDLSGNPVPVTWSLTYPATTSTTGTIDPTGRYQAPPVLPDDNFVTVQATLVADPTQTGSVSFFVTTGPSLTFSTTAADVTSVVNSQGPPLGLKIASSKGKVYLTWVTTPSSGGTKLWYSVGDKNGTFSLPHDILNDVTSFTTGINPPNPENPAIATDGTNIFIAWDDTITSFYQVYLVRGVIGSSPSFAPFAVISNNNPSIRAEPSSMAVQQQRPSIVCSPGGKVELGWEATANGETGIHYIELDKSGNRLRSQDIPRTALANYQVRSSVAADLNGNISIAWVDTNAVQASVPPNIFYSMWPSGQTVFTVPELVEPDPFGLTDQYSMAVDTVGVSFFAFSLTSSQTSTTNTYTASNTGSSFTVPAFRENGTTPTLKIDLLNRSNLSWYDPQTLLVNFMKGDLVFQATSSFQTSGANPVMDIDEGGRVNLLFTTSSGQNVSTWFARGE